MAFVKLSELVSTLSNPQRSDLFVRYLRSAVRAGRFEGADLDTTFTLPKHFTRRGQQGTYQKETPEMVIDQTPVFLAWVQAANAALKPPRGTGDIMQVLRRCEEEARAQHPDEPGAR